MTNQYLFIVLFFFLLAPLKANATVDLLFGGGIGSGSNGNPEGFPANDEDENQGFFAKGHSIDLVISDYWIMFGVRAEEHSMETDNYFYVDQGSGQFRRLNVKAKSRAISGIIGARYELNTPLQIGNGNEVLYSAGVFATIPFDQSNSIEISDSDTSTASRTQGSAKHQKQGALYLDANRSITGGFTAGFQTGVKFSVLKDFRDSAGQEIINYRGNPLELNLASYDFRIYLGFRF